MLGPLLVVALSTAAVHRARLAVRPRCPAVQCGATADYLIRLGCTEEQASKAEGKLLPNIRDSLDAATVEATSNALQSRLALSEAQLRKMVMSRPQVLGYNFESSMSPSLDALQSRLALSEAQLKRVVLLLPTVLGYSFESNISPKLDYLQSALALPLDALRDRVVRFPPLLGYSHAQRFRPRIDACHAAGVDATIVLSRITMTDARFYAALDGSASGRGA